MNPWRTDRQTLDPGRTAWALRGLALNGSGWRVAFVADAKARRERRARWRRGLRALGSGLVLLAALLGAVVLLAALAP